MFNPVIAIWLVLVALTLNVVAFVIRFVEKRRRPHEFSELREARSQSYQAVDRDYRNKTKGAAVYVLRR